MFLLTSHGIDDCSLSWLRDFWATVCKTVRPMLPDRCLSCLSVLSVTVMYCDQTVGWIKIPLDTEVDLGPGHIVLNGDPDLHPERGTTAPSFRPISTVAKRSPISATVVAEHLFTVTSRTLSYSCWSLHNNSTELRLLSGVVLQGSGIGPLLFLSYINELAEVLGCFKVTAKLLNDGVNMYATRKTSCDADSVNLL